MNPTSSNIHDYMQQQGITQSGTAYSVKAKLSDGKEVTVTLHYSAEVKNASQLQKDMEMTKQKMVDVANALQLGTDKGPNSLNIERGKDLEAKYKDHTVIVGDQLIEQYQELQKTQPDQKDVCEQKIKVINDIKNIFSEVVQQSKPAASKGKEEVDEPSSSSSRASPILEKSTASVEEKKRMAPLKSITTTDAGKKVEEKIEEFRKTSLTHSQEKVDYYQTFLNQLDNSQSITEEKLKELIDEKLAAEKTIQNQHTEAILKNHKEIVDTFKELQQAYNNAAKGSEKKLALQSDINRLNSMLALMNLSTSKQKAVEGKAIMVGAVLEKKLDLYNKLAIESKKLPNEGDVQSEKETKKINKEIGKLKKEFSKMPSLEALTEITNEIKGELERLKSNPQEVYSPEEAKKENKYPKELESGRSSLNEALRSAMNWTPICNTALLFSGEGRAYTSESVLMPVGLDENGGGVPAGLREDHKMSATNLLQTTHTIYGDDGGKISEKTSFRGGQFPTKEAAGEALKAMLGNSKVNALHINSLLTPTELTQFKKDKPLLEAHQASINAALEDLIGASIKNNTIKIGKEEYTTKELRVIQRDLMVSNLGVNEGAVGQINKGPLNLNIKLGWHTSIGSYTNKAVDGLNDKIKEILYGLKDLKGEVVIDDTTKPVINRLGAVVHAGLEMEHIWARNDFAEATKGNDQFKQAAYWKVMDMLLGNTSYTNCMSGKDRTGEVESAAQYMYSEIMMKLADHKREVKEKVEAKFPENDATTNKQKNEILEVCGALTLVDIDAILSGDKELNELISEKVDNASKALNEGKLFTPKDVSEKRTIGRRLSPGTLGISKTPPQRNKPGVEEAAATLPVMAPISYYTKIEGKELEKAQFAAANRRKHLFPSMQVTILNTSKGGFKLDPHKYLARMESGFNREYVTQELIKEKGDLDRNKYINLLGLHEVDKTAEKKFLQELANVQGSALKDKKTAFKNVLKKIETYKAEAFKPQAKVKA